MRDRRDLIVLFLTTTVIAVLIAVVVLRASYQRQLDDDRDRLAEAATLQAKLVQEGPSALESGRDVSGDLLSGDLGSQAFAATARLHRLLGRDGTIVVARIEGQTPDGQTPVFLDDPWLPDMPVPLADAALVRSLRRALAGEAGSMIADDAAGERVLLVFAPVSGTPVTGQPLGVVARMPLAGLDAAFVHTAMLTLGVLLALIAATAGIFFMLGRALVRRGQKSESRFCELFDNLRDGGLVARDAGDDFVVSRVNGAFARFEGTIPAQMLGRPLAAAVPSERHGGRLSEVARRVQRSGQPERLPAISANAAQSGSAVQAGSAAQAGGGWFAHDVLRLSDDEIAVLVDDISDQKQAEEALKEGEARWRSIIEAHTQAVVIVDQKHEIRFVNKAAETLFGQAAPDLIGAPFGFPLVQGDVAEIEIIRPGHSIAYGEMRAIPMRWSGQDSFLLIIQDVSAHRRAEGDLRKLFQAIEQSPASVMITDVEGCIEYVNPKFTETTGYTYPEVVGKTPGFLRSGHTSSEEYESLWKIINAGQVWRGEFKNRRKDGELFWELASIAPVRDARGKVTHYVAVKEDISERKATEERLRRAQRMETIGQLTGGVAHDFNNLLAIILGNLQLLEENPALDREGRELIADAIWSAERGAQLTHRLLAFARRQRLNPKITDLNLVVEEMAGLLHRTLGERIAVRENLASGAWLTMIDRGQLESALLNLVVNARDAMPNGGALTIATRLAVLPHDLPNASDDLAPGNYVVLSVTDTGTGMPPEVLERIFEPFFTTKKFGEGSGLGLSMVYGFVRQSGGHIGVESAVGRGTTVSIYLPRADEEVVDVDDRQAARALEKRLSGHEVILIVEDDSRVRKTATNILRKQGYQVVEASDASEALRMVDRMPRLDLLFSDVVLANGINGSELVHQVLCRRPGTRVLLTSGYAQQIPTVEGQPGEGPDLLPKPYRRSELITRVRLILDRVGR